MEEIEITICNWNKYNSTDFAARYPKWFRINNDIWSSESLFNLTSEERWVWVCLLARASQLRTSNFVIKLSWFAHQIKVSKRNILETINKLALTNSLAISTQCVPNSLVPTDRQTDTTDRQTLHNTVAVKNITAPVDVDKVISTLPEETWKKLLGLYEEKWVLAQVQRMAVWLDANILKAPKSTRGWNRFVSGWLQRSWERDRKSLPSVVATHKVNHDALWENENGTAERAND